MTVSALRIRAGLAQSDKLGVGMPMSLLAKLVIVKSLFLLMTWKKTNGTMQKNWLHNVTVQQKKMGLDRQVSLRMAVRL